MDNDFVYNPDKPLVVLRDGKDVGALVAGRLYRFDEALSEHEVFFLVGNDFYQDGLKAGRLEGKTIYLDVNNEVLKILA